MNVSVFSTPSCDAECVDVVFGSLNAADQQRAASIGSLRRRCEFVTGRRLLRHALQALYGVEAAGWQVLADAAGALTLHVADGKDKHEGLPRVSLAHSRGLVVCAVAEVSRLGVDVELPRPRRQLQALAEHVLHADELAGFRQLDERAAEAYFYAKWVLKEALGKALGCGMAYPAQQFLCGEGRLLSAPSAWCEQPHLWRFSVKELPSGHVLGLAVQDTDAAPMLRLYPIKLDP